MRRFASLCIVGGVLIALAWPVYVGVTRSSADARGRAAIERMDTDGPGIPGGPWELERRQALRAARGAQDLSVPAGVLIGAGLAAFGVLLLAIRKPA